MVVGGIHIRKGLLLAFFLILSVHGKCSEHATYFIVTFPAVIEAGSDANMCISLLKPNKLLQLNIYLVHNNQNTILLQENVEKEFHRCSRFKAPLVKGESIQEIKVKVEGEGFEMTQTRKVMFRSYNPITFIQTDKPIYNPGQTVNFRIVTMNANFTTLDQKYSTLTIEDSKRNRIGQWVNVTSMLLQLSHKLNAEAPLGTYHIIANVEYRIIYHAFKVEQYVLPKFEVYINAPKQHCVEKKELKLQVCGKYTYGQPVAGKAEVQVCRKFLQFIFVTDQMVSPCLSEMLELNRNGCGSFIVNVSTFMNSEFEYNLQDSLVISATVSEEGTDTTLFKTVNVQLSYQIGQVEFIELPKNFERGKDIEGKIKVTSFSGKPVPNKEVYLFDDEPWPSKLLFNHTTDINGLASFTINAPDHPRTHILLRSSVHPERFLAYRQPFFAFSQTTVSLLEPANSYSPVYSELLIESSQELFACGTQIPINIKYHIIGETGENFSIDIVYMVLSKGAIVHHGYETVDIKNSADVRKGEISFLLSVSVEMSPAVQIVAYSVLPSENMIASSKDFNVEKCFKNKVSLQFSPSKSVPGEKNTLELSAHPGSLCALSAVDQSVFILESGERLNIDKVFNLLPVQKFSHYPYWIEDAQECLKIRSRRDVKSDHVYETLKGVGLKVATNLAVRKPQCLTYKGTTYHHRSYEMPLHTGIAGPFATKIYALTAHEPVQTDRKFFPETWIWQLFEVGESGSAKVPVTVPDTITTWETETFCLSSIGLGLAPPSTLTVFQPFFLELSLPYSIIRGEVFELKATVFNYLPKCIMVKVTPAPSPHYILQASSDNQYSSCLCANGRKTFKWTLTPSVLGILNVTVSAEAEQSQTVCDNEIVSVPERGRIDTVTRSLLVQAEGTEKIKSQSWLLCPQGNSVSEEFELTVPENVIEGSARASVSVLGDILGRALKNLDGLLSMPYGCGEQNMALLSPNIYILQYLENTQQLTTSIRERATEFLKSGYQRQLNYKHYDGAYSTFGSGEGNTWLTVFVMKNFGKAQRYIYIDSKVINSAKEWLINKQGPDGCFIRQGRLFNNRMKGGVNDNVTMTAYITASFLELGYTVQDNFVNKGLVCLNSSMSNINTYTTALLAYTFSLAGKTKLREELLKELDSVAISQDGRLHWSQLASEDSDALSVEITSYVLLAVLTKIELSAADLGYANRIVSWLVRQQNPYGGFSSTQDTVVALQALALYSTKVFSSDGSSTVTVNSAGGKSHQFDVNQNNKLLYQEETLQDVPGKFSIEVKGSTCVSVQMAQIYNIPTHTEHNTLTITAVTEGNCTKTVGQILSLKFTVKYTGTLNSTNMVIVDIKVLSGFTADPNDLRNSNLVERIDTKDDHLIMYIKELNRNIPVSYVLNIKQVLPVKNLKPAVIKIYDYYQPSDNSETDYTSPCL